MYAYIKALHIIFVVTWFAGLFYMPRLFIYSTEAGDKPDQERDILRAQFAIMMRRLWYGITWPSAVLTLILGVTVMIMGNWHVTLFQPEGRWFLVKWIFILGLYAYHFSLQVLVKQELDGIYKYSSNQLRMWNEVATVFLFAIVMLVAVKQSISLVWGLGGLVALIIVLMAAIRIYKTLRK
ncbi:CopD family protein [Flavihumibacter stibioxidans]|uniref:Protoporphyrinogen IX oxidase n=1 Tax=Flavihumibacter stibioxidans TaxID=1834163 RepID=A0ABR7M984_9BACT|nr:CopD family protein [Flavihumibacter stibioxidans]MBC6491577.1 protoporphyrinogen IX oxidase [Flavihumibacter stibioxidans]